MNYLYFTIFDLLARFFLDKLFLWFQTTRMNSTAVIPEPEPEPAVTILRQYLVHGRTNLSGCVDAFMR